MRTIVVGDVHGCLDELHELLEKISFEKGKDQLIQVGDFMDRGPDPLGCLRFLRETADVVLMGNHEDKHIRWWGHEQKRRETGKKNPMRMYGVRAEQNSQLTEDEVAWMKALPMMYSISPRMVIVHAGLEPAFPVKEQTRAVLRVRYVDEIGEMRGLTKEHTAPEGTKYWADSWKGPESVIYGHAVHSLEKTRVSKFKTKAARGACYGIDTGCVFGGRLTAAVLEQGEVTDFVQVEAHEKYCELLVPNE